MNPSIVVYGPQASGKTRNAKRLCKKFGLSRVIDSFPDGIESRRDIPAHGTLVLTNLEPNLTRLRLKHIHIDTALRGNS